MAIWRLSGKHGCWVSGWGIIVAQHSSFIQVLVFSSRVESSSNYLPSFMSRSSSRRRWQNSVHTHKENFAGPVLVMAGTPLQNYVKKKRTENDVIYLLVQCTFFWYFLNHVSLVKIFKAKFVLLLYGLDHNWTSFWLNKFSCCISDSCAKHYQMAWEFPLAFPFAFV